MNMKATECDLPSKTVRRRKMSTHVEVIVRIDIFDFVVWKRGQKHLKVRMDIFTSPCVSSVMNKERQVSEVLFQKVLNTF